MRWVLSAHVRVCVQSAVLCVHVIQFFRKSLISQRDIKNIPKETFEIITT